MTLRAVLRRCAALLGAIAAAAAVSGCTAATPPASIAYERELALAAESSVGQTFTAPHGGLTALDVPLGYDRSADGVITLRLFERGAATIQETLAQQPVAVVEAPTAGRAAGVQRFALPAPLASHGRSYYARLERTHGPPIGIGAVNATARMDGAAYVNDAPVETQLALQAAYAPVPSALGAAASVLGWLPALLAAAALLLVPGSALLRLLWPDRPTHSWLDDGALSAAIGLAVYPPLLAWTDALGAHLGAANFWLPIAAGAAVHATLAWKSPRPQRAWRKPTSFDLVAVGALAALFATRLLPTSTLALPLWGDAIHHTAIAQRIVDAGGFFSSWQPYADAATFTYHPGFHTFVAGLITLTGDAAPQAALTAGQLMNAAAVIALAPLASRLAGNRWAGLAAVAVAAFLLSMPQSYTNWSRWTQLAGQMILPTAMLAAWSVVRLPQRRTLAIAALCAAGLALTHYRIIILWVIFVAVCWIAENVRRRNERGDILRSAGGAAACGAAVALLCAPWGLRVYQSELARSFSAKLSTPAAATQDAVRAYNASGGFTSYVPLAFWAAAAAATTWLALRGRRAPLVIVAWAGGVWLATNPDVVGLPGAGILSNFAMDIATYIPAAVLIGAAAPATNLVGVAVAAAAVYGLLTRPTDIQPGPHAMAGVADLRAAQWARANLPNDALVAINGFTPNPNGYVAGTDGGWWLRVLAARRTTIPPMQSQAEVHEDADALARTRAFADLTDGDAPPDAAVAQLRALGATHVFVGQIQGTSNHPAGGLTVAALDEMPSVRAIYREDRVGIYDIR
jgi:hypothetical protein